MISTGRECLHRVASCPSPMSRPTARYHRRLQPFTKRDRRRGFDPKRPRAQPWWDRPHAWAI